MQEITTVRGLRRAIRAAKEILITPRFGVSEREVRITKREALYFVSSLKSDETPRDFEIGPCFGSLEDDGVLHLG